MSVTQYYKTNTLSASENGVVPMARGLGVLQFVNKAEIDQLVDRLQEFVRTCHADGAVDITILIPYAELHALSPYGILCCCIGPDAFKDLGIKVSYLFTDECGNHYCIEHGQISYVEKYLRKEIVAAREVKKDYSVITLTRSELGVATVALAEREASLMEMLNIDPCAAHRDMYRAMLSPIQSALAKVRA